MPNAKPSKEQCRTYAEDMNNVAPNTRHSLLKKMGCGFDEAEWKAKHSGGRRSRKASRKNRSASRKNRKNRKASRKGRRGSRRH